MTDDAADALFTSLTPVVAGLAATLGPHAEVVLHDFRRPESSIVAICGALTGRTIGGSMSHIGIGLLGAGDTAGDQINYRIRTPDGRVLKSSTMVLRVEGRVVGALCVNLDTSVLDQAVELLNVIAANPGADGGRAAEAAVFSDDISNVIDALIGDAAHRTPLGRDERLNIISALNRRGVFTLQRAPGRVAELLKVSRATVYNDLAAVRDR